MYFVLHLPDGKEFQPGLIKHSQKKSRYNYRQVEVYLIAELCRKEVFLKCIALFMVAMVFTAVFRRFSRIAKSDYYLRHISLSPFLPSVRPSVRLNVPPHGTTLLPLDEIS